MRDYYFTGKVIKLTEEHYEKWQALYEYVNLWNELTQLDMEYEMRIESGTDDCKGWFMETFKRLHGRNIRSKREGGYPSTRKMSLEQELNDTRWADKGPVIVEHKH